MAELTMALDCLHKLGFAHLDLRPENVGLDRLGHAKLLDFGAAEEMDDEGHIFPGSNLYGCPLYLAPELPLALTKQAGNSHKRKLVDGRKCDYWSLGVCGLEMRSGQVILRNQSQTSINFEFFTNEGLGKILLKVSSVRYFSTKDTSKDTVTCY